MLPTLLLSVVVIGLFFAGVGIRILLVKNGEFRGSCSSNNPYLKNEIGECTVCGRKEGEACGNDTAENALSQ